VATPSAKTDWKDAMAYSVRFLLAALLLTGSPLLAQRQPPTADGMLDARARAEVIDGALDALNQSYVFPDVAQKMEQAIRARQRRKEYDAITSARQLAQTLTDHLREVSRDQHLRVQYSPQVLPPQPAPPGPGVRPPADDQAQFERQRVIMARENFAFVRVERLAGNIGYVDLRAFLPPVIAGETAAAAMTFLAGTDAVIFDVRQNGGGDPAMVAFITSYLFGPEPVHLNDFYHRPTNETRPSYTLPYVPGKRLTDKDVYVLTSSRTFSGAEEFAYNLKHLKRATIVGETTGGGAHLVGPRRISDHFSVGVPLGRPINAVTKTNWEGTGVEPDVAVPAEDALKTAHVIALGKQEQTLPEDARGLRSEVSAALRNLREELAVAASASTGAPVVVAPTPAAKAGDDFESGTLANWTVDRSGAGGWFIYTNGKIAPEPAQSDPNVPFDVPDPPQGRFAAVTDMAGPGRRILYRDVMLDGRYRLHLTVFYVNSSGFSAIDPTRQVLGDDQQYRIDILSPSAPVASIAKGQLLATIFQGKPGDPLTLPPTPITFDLSPWAGQTVRLRLTSADNQGPLRAGVDDIRFERIVQ
jgi:retinol-binding protein 3